jgi:hypothetical protein
MLMELNASPSGVWTLISSLGEFFQGGADGSQDWEPESETRSVQEDWTSVQSGIFLFGLDYQLGIQVIRGSWSGSTDADWNGAWAEWSWLIADAPIGNAIDCQSPDW